MIVVPASLVGSMLDQVGVFIPRLVAALVLLIAGIIVARLVSKAARRGLTAAGLDRMADNWGVHDATERVGLGRSLSATIATVVRVIILFVTVLVAVSLLGVPALEQSMNEAILFLPRLVVALVILMLGLVAGNSARDRVDRLSRQMDLGAGPGVATMIGVLAIAVDGVIYAPGWAGTVQEVFQDAAQNVYRVVDGRFSPMAFLDTDGWWTSRLQVLPLLRELFGPEEFARSVRVSPEPDALLAFLLGHHEQPLHP